MEKFFLYLFITACGGLLFWGMREPTRVYQYPFLIGAIFTAFLLPQAIALVNNPGPVPSAAVSKVLFMGILCMVMAWIGYQIRPLAFVRRSSPRVLNFKRVRFAAFVTGLISLLAVYGMLGISQDEIRTGTGLFTIYSFFSGLAVISFPIFLSFSIWKPGLKNLALAFIAGYPLYSAALFSGRRTSTATFILILAVVFFFQKRYVPPRLVVLATVVLVLFLIPVFAQLREEFWTTLLTGNLAVIDWQGALNKVLSGDILELRNAAAAIFSTELTGNYGFGTGYWDAIVFRYVPGQFVGFDFKQSMQFNWVNSVYEAIGYQSSTGTTQTVLGDAYVQLGYFGSLFFLLQGYLFKNLWTLAVVRQSFMVQILYVALLTPALTGVTHGSRWFIQAALLIIIVVYAIYIFARIRKAITFVDIGSQSDHRSPIS